MKLALLALSAVAAYGYDNGSPNSRLPILGLSTWVALGPGAQHPIFDFCDQDSVKHMIDALVSPELGLYEAGYRNFHLDDCWAGGRDENGNVYAEKDHFPDGMKPVVDYAHSKGLAFGLYTCGGNTTCVGGRPGSAYHWQKDADTYAEWGVDWVKMDWCNHGDQDPKVAYPTMSKALNTSGRHIHFNMCEWGDEDPWEWGDAIAQSWRMSGDHEGTWDSTKSQIQQSAAIPAEYTGRPWGWNDMDMLETGNGPRSAHANGKEANMTRDEWITEFSMWAISASPLVVTTPIMNCSNVSPHPSGYCNVTLKDQHSHAQCVKGQSFGCYLNGSMWTDEGCRGEFTCNGYDTLCDVDGDGTHVCTCGNQTKCVPWITPLQREILLNTEVIAINQDVTPQGRPVNDGDLTVWARHLSDGSVAVALFNQDDDAAQITADFTSWGWASSDTADIRDLWKQADLGSFTGSYGPVSVRPHQTIVLRITKH